MVGHAFAVLDPALWTISGSLLATLASRVIYGLQEKVYEARQLGQYTLEAKIGEGGMGQIFRASHAMLRRPTAIKLLPGEHSETQLRRFEREVRLTASLTHPNTISIFDFGRTPEGTFYYAMELLYGLNLENLIERYGVQPPGRVSNILLQACGALSEAHGVGLIHRDIKPANIYLCRLGGIDDFVKVLDFGLVRQQKDDVSLTQSNTHSLVGTPLYMPPESIVAPDKINAQADLYSLGATAYHLLTGSPPFTGASVLEVCGHHLHTVPEPPSKRLGQPLPEALERIVLSCLAKNPGERPGGAKALAKLLKEADGIPAFDAEHARHFWDEVFDGSTRHERSVSGQTLHIALGDRVERVRDFPKSA
jgi:serine/threonine-protein kinase